ncbi:MAG: FAD-dependent monooxygenase [Pseudomonadota bacterium]
MTQTVIVGAGIGGLCAALGLARAGRRVTVFEQAPELGEVGAGISLAPNAMKGLRHIGLESNVETLADEPLEQYTRHYQTAEPLVTIDRHNTRDQLGAGYLQMHRADLHDLLVAALREVQADAIKLGYRLSGVDSADDGATLHFDNGEQHTADVVIGADGLRSIVRETVFAARGGDYAGVVAWRGLVPTEALGDVALLDGSNVFVGPQRIFVRYPVRRGAIQNFVAFTREPDWAAEGWTQKGSRSALRSHFEDFHPEVLATIDALGDAACFRWGLFERKPLDRWVKGSVALLGDAAHPMLPWFGQGAATAIEDGVVLARSLVEAPTIHDGLLWYERARRERVTEIHRESSLGGERLLNAYKTLLKAEPVRTEDTLGMTLYDPGTVALA